jgi:hypothetical protein
MLRNCLVAGLPLVMLSRPVHAAPNVGALPYTPYTFPASAGTGALPGGSGAPVNVGILSYNALQTMSATQCQYIENSWEDDFTLSLNLSRWIPTGSANAASYGFGSSVTKASISSSNGNVNYGNEAFGIVLDHCPSAGSVGAANPSTCTALNPTALSFGADLPGYSTTTGSADKGLIMTLSQQPVRFP